MTCTYCLCKNIIKLSKLIRRSVNWSLPGPQLGTFCLTLTGVEHGNILYLLGNHCSLYNFVYSEKIYMYFVFCYSNMLHYDVYMEGLPSLYAFFLSITELYHSYQQSQTVQLSHVMCSLLVLQTDLIYQTQPYLDPAGSKAKSERQILSTCSSVSVIQIF